MTVGIRDVIHLLQEPLANAGFAKRAGQVFTLPLGDQTLGWLGLNYGIERSVGIRVHPVMGVRHQGVERWVAQLCGDAFHPYQPPTVSRPLTALSSRHEWFFEVNSANEAIGHQLVRAVVDHGMPFLRQTTSLAALWARIQQGWGFHLEYREPVVLALLDKADEAIATLESSLAGLGDRGDLAAQKFRSFAHAFRSAMPLSA